MSNIVIINGKSYSGGSNIVVHGSGTVTIDGKNINAPDDKEISITIQGDIESLTVNACNDITVNGKVEKLDVKAGNVTCDTVTGSISSKAGILNIGNISKASFD